MLLLSVLLLSVANLAQLNLLCQPEVLDADHNGGEDGESAPFSDVVCEENMF